MHSKKSKITGLLHKGFKPDKCKTSLKMGMSRMKLMRNKRDVQLKQMKREVAQLLESGQEQTARIRVEHVIREEKTIAAYEFLELYCELIISRLHIIDGQKACPIDLKEAIASVVFAAPRCADIPELSDVKSQFQSKYGKDFVISSLEVRPDSGVARVVVEKLSATAPDINTKVKVLKAIAEENNIKWDPKGFEDELRKPQSEKLGGNSKFYSASEMAQNVPFQPAPPVGAYQPPNQMPAYYDTNNYNNSNSNNNSENIPPTGPTRFSNQSSDPPPAPVHVRAPSASRPAEPNYKRPQNIPDSDTEYLTVEEAADAAAKSAEIASKAAKAAADMARHGSLSREPSIASNNSFSSPRNSPKTRPDFEEVNSVSRPVRNNSSSSRVRPNPNPNPRAEVAPPSPPHSSASSSGSDHFTEPRPAERRRVEKSESYVSKRKVVKKEEEIDYSGFNTAQYKKEEEEDRYSGFDTRYKEEEDEEDRYSGFDTRYKEEEDEEDRYSGFNTQYKKSTSKGSRNSFGGGAVWDYNEEITSPKATFDSSSVFFDESNKKGAFERESSSKHKREESSSNRRPTNFSFDDDVIIPSPKPARSTGSGSKFSFDSAPSPKPFNDSALSPKPARHGSAFNDEPSLLSILSTGAQLPPKPDHPKFDSDAESGLDVKLEIPKFDSGPNFDNVDYSDHEHEKEIEEEAKIVEDVSYKRPSQSSLFNAKEKVKEKEKEKEVISSSDERIQETKPQSMRTKNPIRKGPLRYSPKEEREDSSRSDEEDQQVLNYDFNFGGRKNRVGNPYASPPYLKPSLEEPKPSKSKPSLDEPKPSKSKPVRLSEIGDESVEERRFNKPKQLYGKAKEEEESASRIPVLGSDSDSDDGYEPTSYQKFKNLRGKKDEYSYNSGVKKEETAPRYRPTRVNLIEEEEVQKPVRKTMKESGGSSRVRQDYTGFDDDQDESGLYNKPVGKPSAARRNAREEPLRYTFNQTISDDQAEEEKEYDEPAPPLVSRKRTDMRSQSKPVKDQQTKATKEYDDDDDLYNRPSKEIPNRASVARRNPRESLNYTNSDEEEKQERMPAKRADKSPVQSKPSTERISQPKRSPVYEEEKIRITSSLPPPTQVPQEGRKHNSLNLEMDKKKQEEAKASEESESEEEETKDDVAPSRPTMFPLDMDALRARVKEIQATMR